MLSELNPLPASAPLRAVTSTAADPRRVIAAGSCSAFVAVADPLTRQAVEASQALDRASRAALRAMFQDRDIEVTSFHDDGAGRIVYQVADRSSGEVLLQSPSEALLRFFASARAALSEPLVAVDA